MSVIAPIAIVVLVLLGSYRQYRRQQALGIKTNWVEAVVVMLICTVIALAAIGCVYLGINFNQGLPAAILCFLVLVGGLIALIAWAPHRWPLPDMPGPIPWRTGMLIAGGSAVFAIALITLMLVRLAAGEIAANIVAGIVAVAGLALLVQAARRWRPSVIETQSNP